MGSRARAPTGAGGAILRAGAYACAIILSPCVCVHYWILILVFILLFNSRCVFAGRAHVYYRISDTHTHIYIELKLIIIATRASLALCDSTQVLEQIARACLNNNTCIGQSAEPVWANPRCVCVSVCCCRRCCVGSILPCTYVGNQFPIQYSSIVWEKKRAYARAQH